MLLQDACRDGLVLAKTLKDHTQVATCSGRQLPWQLQEISCDLPLPSQAVTLPTVTVIS